MTAADTEQATEQAVMQAVAALPSLTDDQCVRIAHLLSLSPSWQASTAAADRTPTPRRPRRSQQPSRPRSAGSASNLAVLMLMPLLLLVLLLRDIATQQRAAATFDVHVRTIRNWISKGLITGYRTPAGRAIRVDIDEIGNMLQRVPTTVARGPRDPFGPEARIVDIPAGTVVAEETVDDDEDADDDLLDDADEGDEVLAASAADPDDDPGFDLVPTGTVLPDTVEALVVDGLVLAADWGVVGAAGHVLTTAPHAAVRELARLALVGLICDRERQTAQAAEEAGR